MRDKFNAFLTKQMFEPSLIGIFVNPFYLARIALLREIKTSGKEIVGKTLDVGCGTKPYEKFFSSSKYTGLEIETTINREDKSVDVFYDGGKFPFADNEFDSIVTNQVLEHVFNPTEFLSEINRVLKLNGNLLLTVPFVWDEHEQPYDYARYSSFGLAHLLKQHGFEIVESKKTANDFRIFAQLLNAYIYKITQRNKVIRQLFTFFIMSIISILGMLLSKILPKNNDLYLDNIILAKKIENVQLLHTV